MVAEVPSSRTALPNPPAPPARLKLAAAAIFSLPPAFSGAALVLKTKRMPCGGRGDATNALKYGLDQAGCPNALGQLAPKQVFGIGALTVFFDRSFNAARILSDICAGPVLTTLMPSLPIEAVMFVPSATSM